MKTTVAVAAELGIHPGTIRGWVRAGLVPVTRQPSGRRLRWSEEQVEQIRRAMDVAATTARTGGRGG